jgi:hypothetical protein
MIFFRVLRMLKQRVITAVRLAGHPAAGFVRPSTHPLAVVTLLMPPRVRGEWAA